VKWLLLVLAILLPLRAALGVATPAHGQPRQLASMAVPGKALARGEAQRAGGAEAQDCFGPDCELGPLSTWAFGSAAPMRPRWRPASALPNFSFIWVPPERPPRLS
jgi:hypothetical protein